MASQTKTTGCTAMKKARSPHQPTGSLARKDLRLAIYLRDRFTCLHCLKDLHGADPRDITLDHAKCRSDGGSDTHDNMFTACRKCNCSRQDKPLARFAGPETVKHIRRNLKRSIASYRKLAKAILAGEVGFEESFKNLSK